MKQNLCGLAVLCLVPAVSAAAGKDDPVLTKVTIDQLEVRMTEGPDPWVLDAQAWIGRDLEKLWLKVEAENVDGHIAEAEVQALYGRAIAPYWDLQLGWRHDIRPEPSRDWLVVGLEGLAPYWLEVDAAAFLGEGGQVAVRLKGEYEWMFTQRWVLSPEMEVNMYRKDDEELGVGAGLSDLVLGLRLRYEMRREFAPYVGVNWTRAFGNTADFARDEGEDSNDIQFVAGVRAWF